MGDTSQPVDARAATGAKFLEAIWRYYSLIDFVVSQRHPQSALAVRLAVDEAEVYLKAPAAESGPRPAPAAAERPAPAGRGASTPAAAPAGLAPDRARASFQRIAQALGDVVQAFRAQALPSSSRRKS